MPQTMTVPTLEEVRTAIAMGALDDSLEQIQDAVNRRRPFALQPGARVILNQTARPAYIRGIEGIVVRVNEKSALVEFEPTDKQRQKAQRYSFNRPIRCPLSILSPAA